MYQIIIAEDELLVRMGLKNSIDWGSFDMQVVADAADGKSAFELYEKFQPDLIVTDLNMPIMSGMELISKIRERDKNVRIIILTCLEEFELARKAVSLGISEYIVKHMMTQDNIQNVLSRVQKDLTLNKDNKTSSELIKANIEIIKEKLVRDLILYNNCPEKDFTSILTDLKFRLKGPSIILCALDISHYARIDSPMVRESVLSMLNDITAFHRGGVFIFIDNTKFGMIIGCENVINEKAVSEDVSLLLKDIEASIKRLLNTSVSFGLSNTGSDYSLLHGMYHQAMEALESKFFGGIGVYSHSFPFDRERALHEKTEEMLKLCEAENNSIGLVTVYFQKIRAAVKAGGRTGREYSEEFCGLIRWAVSALKIPGDGNEQITVAAVSSIESIQQSETMDEILRVLYDFFSKITAIVKRKRIKSGEVIKAADYMEANYCKDLSLQQVADYVKLSPNYLSSLFKKEMDTSFTDYLTDIRIEKAKELLLDTYLRTYEIAESVGFNENAYFCKIFKKVTGKTPSEFRKQWLMRSTEEPDDETDRRL